MENPLINATSGDVNTVRRTRSPTPPVAEQGQERVDTVDPLRVPETEPSPKTPNSSLNSSSTVMPSPSGELTFEALDSRKRHLSDSEDTGSPQRTSKLPRIMNHGIGEEADASHPVVEQAVMAIPQDRSSGTPLVPVKSENLEPNLSQPRTNAALGPYARLYEIQEGRFYCLIC